MARKRTLPASPASYKGDHVGMLEPGGDPRLPSETFPEPSVLGKLRSEDLERDLPPEPSVFREIDDTHAAAAEHRFDPVAPDLVTDLDIAHTGPS